MYAHLQSAAKPVTMVSKFLEELALNSAPSPTAIFAKQKTPAPDVMEVLLSLKANLLVIITAASLDALHVVVQQPALNAIQALR